MTTTATRDQQLEAAYRDSVYVIHSGTLRIESRIDRECVALAALMRRCGVGTAALISACNPDSQPLPPERNLLRQRAFEDALNEHNYAFLPALGRSADGAWQEPSVLVLGISEEEACGFARQWGQRALVLYDARGCARLRFVDQGGA